MSNELVVNIKDFEQALNFEVDYICDSLDMDLEILIACKVKSGRVVVDIFDSGDLHMITTTVNKYNNMQVYGVAVGYTTGKIIKLLKDKYKI